MRRHITGKQKVVLGAIAGDIIGSPFEFDNVKAQSFPLFSESSRVTDDSIMTLAVAWAIMRSNEKAIPLSRSAIECMHALAKRYPHVGYGPRFAEWLRTPTTHCEPYGSWGNGAAMRVSPVAWAYDDIELVEYNAAITAEVSHNHPDGIRGAQAVASAIFMVRHGCTKGQLRAYIEKRFKYDLDFFLDDIRDEYNFDVSCNGSVPPAIVAFLEGDSFEDVIRKAISIGGDSDTIAAMAASIAQAIYAIPPDIAEQSHVRLDSRLAHINDEFCFKYLQ